METTDILALAKAGQAKGYNDPQRLIERFEAIIARNGAYLARRANRGVRTPTDEALSEDNEALAMAIVMLESMQ